MFPTPFEWSTADPSRAIVPVSTMARAHERPKPIAPWLPAQQMPPLFRDSKRTSQLKTLARLKTPQAPRNTN